MNIVINQESIIFWKDVFFNSASVISFCFAMRCQYKGDYSTSDFLVMLAIFLKLWAV